MGSTEYDAIVIGSGPNGLAAAITIAQAGHSVIVLEAKPTIGGGMRSAELTLPGFTHDICSAIHPLGIASPFFKALPLHAHALEWIQPQIPLAHPLDDGSAVVLERSVNETALRLGDDAEAYQRLFHPLTEKWDLLADDLLGPLRIPKHPLDMIQFGWLGMRSAQGLWQTFFTTSQAKSLFAGLSAHSILPLDKAITAAFGLILGTLGHAAGWPLPKGGSQAIANALASYLRSLGGKIETHTEVKSLKELPASRLILCDVTPKQLLQIAGEQLPAHYKNQLLRYRYGPGVFKIDWALSCPIPWKAHECLQAGTVHIGGTEDEIFTSEKTVWDNRPPDRPYVILAQQSLFDPSRAPAGKHTGWAYCHVPPGCEVDMTDRIESQIERFAPGFKDCILAKSTKSPQELHAYNANYIGGDINGGVQDICQLFTRPTIRWNPYSTPIKGLYICSSSTPPGGGVHGMCGYHAALAALQSFKF